MNQYLKVLNLTELATLDEVKAAFRKLAKQYHPDATHTSDSRKFIEVNNAYEWLKKNHIPAKKPVEVHLVRKYYRHIQDDKYFAWLANKVINIPEEILSLDTTIYLMIGSNEYRINIGKGTKLPIVMESTNLKVKIRYGSDG